MSDKFLDDIEESLAVASDKPALQLPQKFKVILVNDDYTPMEFVVLLLQKLFFMDEERATRIMLQIHTQGKGICGVYSRDVAETKVNQVNNASRANDYPLLCEMEPE